jgi:glycerophosphoryl diester phosphodiesterase
MSPPLHPFLDWPEPIPFAHRGGASVASENTLAAFAHAVGLGYRYLETDVHATRDGVIVAFHDPDLQRTCGRAGVIGDLAWSEVATARVDGKEPIPLLEELLEEFPDVRINIDCKTDAAVDGLIATVRRTSCIERVCLASFSQARLHRLRRSLGPEACVALGPRQIASLRLFGRMPGNLGPAQVPTRSGAVPLVDRRFIQHCHRVGVPVHVWTIDDPVEMHRLLDLGVDGIMTDRTDLLRDVLLDRGQWR